MASRIRKTIVPRNWLFGRLSFINNNLYNIIKVNHSNFTPEELNVLMECYEKIKKVISFKLESSEELKTKIREEEKEFSNIKN